MDRKKEAVHPAVKKVEDVNSLHRDLFRQRVGTLRDENSDESSIYVHGQEQERLIFNHGHEEEDEYESDGYIGNTTKIKKNDPDTKILLRTGYYARSITNEEWEELGRDISNNTHLKTLQLFYDALDDQKITFLFRALTRSDSLKTITLRNNGLSLAVTRSMGQFLRNASRLQWLDLDNNNIQSEGFNFFVSGVA